MDSDSESEALLMDSQAGNMWEWIQKHYPGYVDSYLMFEAGRLFGNYVTSLMEWSEFKAELSNYIDFGKATQQSTKQMFAVIAEIRLLLSGPVFGNSMPKWFQRVVLLELVKWAVPLQACGDDSNNHNDVKLILTEASVAKLKFDDTFHQQTAGSTSVKMMRKLSVAAADPKPKPKAAAKKGKAVPKKSDLKVIGHGKVEQCADNIAVAGETRARVWFDDLQSAIHFALGEPAHNSKLPTSLVPIVAHATRLGIIFAFNEAVTIAGVEYLKWSLVRKMLQRMVASAKDNYDSVSQQQGENLPMDFAALRQIVNDISAEESEDSLPCVSPTSGTTLDNLYYPSEADVATMLQWAHSTTKSMRFHAAYVSMQEAVLFNIGTISSISALCTCVRQSIVNVVPAATWNLLQHAADYIASGAAQAALDTSCAPHVAAAVKELRSELESSNAESLFSIRAQYALGLVKTFIDECDGRAVFVKTIRYDLLKNHMTEVKQIDLGIMHGDDKSWDAAWAKLLTTIEPAMISKFAAEKATATSRRRDRTYAGPTQVQVSDVVDTVADKTSVAFTAIDDIYFISSSQSLTKVQYTKSIIQAQVWIHYHNSVREWGASVKARTQGDKSTTIVAVNAPDGLRIPFAGEVLVGGGSKDSRREVFYMGEYEGMKYYLSAGNHNQLDGECAAVPWLVKTSKKPVQFNCEIVKCGLPIPQLGDDVSLLLPWIQTTEAVESESDMFRPLSSDDMAITGIKRAMGQECTKEKPAKKVKHLHG